jgi:AcrR family transcriptional regulator
MSATNDSGTTRQAAILEAASGIFLRYGFKKTSMDDVARAVGISRQALYLHFQTKEALFRAMVAHTLEAMHARASAALAREDLGLEDRVLGAFEALHGKAVGIEHLGELIAATTALIGPVFRKVEQTLIADVARVLDAAGVAARWKEEEISARDLAEHLSATSEGIKHTAQTPVDYLDRMRIAVRIVCGGTSSRTSSHLAASSGRPTREPKKRAVHRHD